MQLVIGGASESNKWVSLYMSVVYSRDTFDSS